MTEKEEREWLKRARAGYSWMSNDQWDCYLMLGELVFGWHHLSGKVKPYGAGIETNVYGGIATHDSDILTRAVFLAHARCVRFEIGPSGPGLLRYILHKRHLRDGGESRDRHPTIETALARYRTRNPA